jgi:flavin-dependent dehydrogenase
MNARDRDECVLEADTTTLADAASRVWDLVVIGAGPAGAIVARGLAQRNRSILVVEAKTFPRNKVCGGCLNARTLELLARAGLGEMPTEVGGVPLTKFQVHVSGRSASITMPAGVSLSRARFDQELLAAAVESGARVLTGATATVAEECDSNCRRVDVQRGAEHASLRAACVVCADGLRRSSMRKIASLRAKVSRRSYVGLGATLTAPQLFADASEVVPRGTIVMAVGSMGYVGLARAECDGLSVAAALSPRAIRRAGSAASAIGDILTSAGVPFPLDVPAIDWTGTTPLTSSARRVAAERLFVVGDAAGYVEPFTGEGIAAALESALLVAPLVDRAVDGWSVALADEWRATYNRAVRCRQWLCRGLTWFLRLPSIVQPVLPWLLQVPAVVQPILARINDTRVSADLALYGPPRSRDTP